MEVTRTSRRNSSWLPEIEAIKFTFPDGSQRKNGRISP